MKRATPKVAKKKGPPKARKPSVRRHYPSETSRRQVSAMAGYGIGEREIAVVIGIARDTLRNHYASELETGQALAKVNIGKSLYEQGVGRPAEFDERGKMLREELKPDRSVAIFLGKARLGFKETDRRELTGADGGPIQVASLDLSLLTDDEAKQLRFLLAKAQPVPDGSKG